MDNFELYYRLNKDGSSEKITGVPPLSFVSNGENLVDYRIDGASGGVGDRTGNLFDGNFLQGYWAYANGAFIYVNTWICTTKIPCTGDQMYTCSFSKASRWFGFVWYDGDGDYISTNNRQDGSNTQYRLYCATAPSNATYMAINIAGYPDYSVTVLPSDITDLMIVEGSTALPYEPYGYKIPIVCGGTTTNIYLDEPLEENESISMSDTGVSIPTINGSNTLSIGTTVQPSNIYIKYGDGGSDNSSLLKYLKYKYKYAKE